MDTGLNAGKGAGKGAGAGPLNDAANSHAAAAAMPQPTVPVASPRSRARRNARAWVWAVAARCTLTASARYAASVSRISKRVPHGGGTSSWEGITESDKAYLRSAKSDATLPAYPGEADQRIDISIAKMR